MRKLEMSEMALIEGGDLGFWTGLSCGAFVIGTFASGGAGLIFAGVGAIACGAAFGLELGE